MKAILRTYHDEISHSDETVTVDDDHDFTDSYADTVPFTVGSNQAILPIEDQTQKTMQKYRFKVEHDNGTAYLSTVAGTLQEAVDRICRVEQCPERALTFAPDSEHYFTKEEKRRRIEMLEENLAFNAKLHRQGKRDDETYQTCRKDAQKAINEINNAKTERTI